MGGATGSAFDNVAARLFHISPELREVAVVSGLGVRAHQIARDVDVIPMSAIAAFWHRRGPKQILPFAFDPIRRAAQPNSVARPLSVRFSQKTQKVLRTKNVIVPGPVRASLYTDATQAASAY
jgi:hypothetical protein